MCPDEKFPNCVKFEEKNTKYEIYQGEHKIIKKTWRVLKEEYGFFFSSRTMITHFVAMSCAEITFWVCREEPFRALLPESFCAWKVATQKGGLTLQID